jgi:hypothetical protein
LREQLPNLGLPVIQNLRIPSEEVIEQKTTQPSKQAMLTELEFLLQQWTLKIHPHFQQLLQELADYRVPDSSITQDSVMALGFAVTHRHRVHDIPSGGRIDRVLLDDLNATYRPADLAGASLPWMTRN